MMIDTHRGETRIKSEGAKYLPVTDGQEQDGLKAGQPGVTAYLAYKMRASFPDVVKTAVEAMVGVMHHKPPVIELPSALESMREAATTDGESLEMLLRRVNEAQLITGRLGLLLDVVDGSPVGTMPYVALYGATTIINWDEGNRGDPLRQNLNLVVLEEDSPVRQLDFTWTKKKKFRVLVLGDLVENEPQGGGVYQVGVFEEADSFSTEGLISPSLAGGTLDEIPFVFVNPKDVVSTPDLPPLLGLAQLALTIYRGEADYRQALFMQGQDTLVVTGDNNPDTKYRTGANAVIAVPTGGDAKFIGVASEGLSEMRSALENDKVLASQKGGQLLDTVSRAKESGDALKIRVSARTATLNQIALAGAFGLQQLLRIAARWLGADPEQVVVTPNLDFADDQLGGKTLVEYMTAKKLGAPFALESIHDLMREKDLTTRTFKEELDLLAEEEDLVDPGGDGLSEDEGGLLDDDEG